MFRRTTIYTLECKVMQQSVRNGHKGQHPCHSVDAISNSRRLPTLPPAHAGHAGHVRLRHSGTAWWQPHASDASGSVAWWQPHDGYVWVCIGTYLSLHLRVSRPAGPGLSVETLPTTRTHLQAESSLTGARDPQAIRLYIASFCLNIHEIP